MKVYIMKRNSFKIRISAALTAFITAVNFAAPAFTDINVPGQLITYAAEQGSVNTDRLNVRSGPGTSYGKVATLGAGTKVTVNSETTGNDGYKWYSISFTGGSGYARYDYITKNATYAVQSADFESYLNAQGFPESYKNALRGLHQKYPNWVFEAQQTGLDWNTVVSEESKIGRNLVANTSISSWKSLSAGAFDWASNYWPGFDGATWVQASQDLISYYLDPRNFLTDPYVFQFEIQKYDPSTQTKEGLNSLIKGTFLEGEAIVPIAGSVIEGGTVIEGSTYNPSAAGSVSGSSSSSSTSSSGSAVIGPGGPGANVIIGNGVVTGSGSGSNSGSSNSGGNSSASNSKGNSSSSSKSSSKKASKQNKAKTADSKDKSENTDNKSDSSNDSKDAEDSNDASPKSASADGSVMSAQEENAQTESKNNTKNVIIIVVCAVIVLLLVLALILYARKKRKQD